MLLLVGYGAWGVVQYLLASASFSDGGKAGSNAV
jgi:hypothetical protein